MIVSKKIPVPRSMRWRRDAFGVVTELLAKISIVFILSIPFQSLEPGPDHSRGAAQLMRFRLTVAPAPAHPGNGSF
jgi:hypothetical protein